MKRFLSTLFLLAAASSSGWAAATVNFGAQSFNGFTDATGNAVASGDLFEVGTFTISDAVIQQNQGNLAFLQSHFIEFSSTTIGGNNPFPPGYAGASAVGNTDSLSLTGTQIYYWLFNAATAGASTQEGIYYLSDAVNRNWAFPANNSGITTVTTDIADLTGSSDNLISGANVVIGNFGPATTSALGTATAFELAAPVPEPASAALAILGGAAFLIRRRRSA